MNLHKFVLVIILPFLFSCGGQNRTGSGSSINPSDYSIAYNVLTDDSTNNYDVFTMDIDGSNKKNITNLPGMEWTYFAEGGRVYFVSDKDTCHRCFFLYEMNYKGENVKRVSDIQLADSWMSSRKNGTELIVTPARKVDSAFYIIDSNGKLLHRIETGLAFAADPLFIFEGTRIVFRGGLTKSKLIEGFNEELYIIDDDGKNRVQLTHFPKGDTTAGKFDYKAGTPKRHPLDNFISYQSRQNGKYGLYGVSSLGNMHWKLTDTEENVGWHDWSPNGKLLIFDSFDDEQTQFDIGIMNRETGEIKFLTDTSFSIEQSPVFVLKN